MAKVEIRFTPTEKQWSFITCNADIVVFGGARGGGKTAASLADFWYHSEVFGPKAHGLMVRKTREALADTRMAAIRLYGNAARWVDKGTHFRFRNGATLDFRYLENEQDAQNYQGWELTRLYVEELTQFNSLDPVWLLMATLRSPAGIKTQLKATCNPGGPSHFAVKSEFIDHGENLLWHDPETNLTRIFIPSLITDNPHLLENDPGYLNRLASVGSRLFRAWRYGDWDITEGAYFPEFERRRHVIPPFPIPSFWIKYRSCDWGSAAPFAVHWWAVVQEDMEHAGCVLPRGAIVAYREWYGASKPNVGLWMTAQEVAKGIVELETDRKGKREHLSFGVIDPSAFAVTSGPSIAETLLRHGVTFKRADNRRTAQSHDQRAGGWTELRARLKGNDDGHPMIFFFDICPAIIRTLPMLQSDPHRPEDVDTNLEDHAADSCRYAVMARPYTARVAADANSKSPWLVANAFRLHELRD